LIYHDWKNDTSRPIFMNSQLRELLESGILINHNNKNIKYIAIVGVIELSIDFCIPSWNFINIKKYIFHVII